MADLPKEATDSAISMTNKLSRTVKSKRYRRRIIRYGLLTGNIAIVVVATILVLHNPSSKNTQHSSASVANSQATNPLDTLSAADIAVTAARMTNLAESTAVNNQADSVAAELNTQVVDYAVVPKPQILSSVNKTKYDIKDYTTVAGDTLGDLANRFGVTSDSIKWSNGLTGSVLKAGTNLIIPPIDGIAYKVKAGDTAESLATKYSANKDQIIAFNDAEVSGLKVDDRIVIPGGSIAAPVTTRYYVSIPYGGPTYAGNGYDYGQCTWYVSNRRAELGRPVPSNLGNAYSWYVRAQYDGLPTGTEPQIGAVTVTIGANHVMVVEQINDDGSFWVSEMNYYGGGQAGINDPRPVGGWNIRDYRLIRSASGYRFIY